MKKSIKLTSMEKMYVLFLGVLIISCLSILISAPSIFILPIVIFTIITIDDKLKLYMKKERAFVAKKLVYIGKKVQKEYTTAYKVFMEIFEILEIIHDFNVFIYLYFIFSIAENVFIYKIKTFNLKQNNNKSNSNKTENKKEEVVVVEYSNVIDLFELEDGFTISDLKKSYRRLVKQYHPDNNGDIELFKQISVVYSELLSTI